MEIRRGRDFRSGDTPPRISEHDDPVPGVGIVNAAFARSYFDGQDPVGRRVMIRPKNLVRAPMEIVGVVNDTLYSSVRDPLRPIVYVPVEERSNGTISIRTAGDPLLQAARIRRLISGVRPTSRTQVIPMSSLVRRQMVRERLLATLAAFFAIVALLLACIGLYGVLHYGILSQRREIGVRMALGARASHIAVRITREMAVIVGCGAVGGLLGGFAFGRLIERVLFRTTVADPLSLLGPLLMLSIAAAFAALPPILRAVQVDPAETLRAD
jgi:hypothetical protein